MSDKVFEGILGRDANGNHNMVMGPWGGLTVHSRRSDSLGAIVRSGNDLFQTPDSYRIAVGV
jgi:hypothetical protein